MKQLLIVNSAKALNATGATPLDLSGLEKGAITFFEVGESNPLSAAPTKNFGIALGRGNNSPAFVIPEVDIETLEITKTLPKAGKKFKAVFTFNTPVVGKEYTVVLIKKGTVLNQRTTWTTSIVAKTTTAATEASALVAAINAKTNGEFQITASASSAAVTIQATDNTDWEIKFVDELAGTTLTTSSSNSYEKTIGDKAYVQDLASRCAAGKGYNLLGGDGKGIYPGYPEDVEDLVPNTSGSSGASTAGYAIYNLHFATRRLAGKQLNELVWQYVHIAVPITNSSYSTFDTILPEGKFTQVANKATASGQSNG